MLQKVIAIGLLLAVLCVGQAPALEAKEHRPGASATVEDLFLSDARFADAVRQVLDWPWDIGGRDVRQLREENLGYGEISLLYGLAKETGRPVRELLQLRKDEKMGWGQIARHYGVKVGDAHRRADSILERCGMEPEKGRLRIRIEADEREHRDHDERGAHGRAAAPGNHKH